MDRVSDFLVAMEETTNERIFKFSGAFKDPEANKIRDIAAQALKDYKAGNYDAAIRGFMEAKKRVLEFKQKIATIKEPVTAEERRKENSESFLKFMAFATGFMLTCIVSVPITCIALFGQMISLAKYEGLDLTYNGDDDGYTIKQYQDELSRASTNEAKERAQLICNRFIFYCDKFIGLCQKAKQAEVL